MVVEALFVLLRLRAEWLGGHLGWGGVFAVGGLGLWRISATREGEEVAGANVGHLGIGHPGYPVNVKMGLC